MGHQTQLLLCITNLILSMVFQQKGPGVYRIPRNPNRGTNTRQREDDEQDRLVCIFLFFSTLPATDQTLALD